MARPTYHRTAPCPCCDRDIEWAAQDEPVAHRIEECMDRLCDAQSCAGLDFEGLTRCDVCRSRYCAEHIAISILETGETLCYRCLAHQHARLMRTLGWVADQFAANGQPAMEAGVEVTMGRLARRFKEAE